MADNINVSEGSGKTVAADEILSVLYQRVKFTLGADGTNDGDVSSANPLPVTGTITANIGTVGTLATAAKQDTGNTSLSSIDTKIPALGQALAAASVPVVLTAAQLTTLTPLATVAATQSGTWNITNVSGTISLPTGASTLAEQQSQTTHLATIAGDTTDIETAVELIDDVIATLGTTTYTEATTKGAIIGAVRRDADTTLVNTTNEVGPLQMDANGRLKVEAFSGETLPVSLTSTTVTGTVAVTQSGTWDEVGINDSGNSITVDYATTGSGTATGALRVELPTNGTGVIATVGAVTAITNALPAGTNAIGKLSANTGVDIGDVDVTSIVPGTGATNLGKAEDSGHTTADTGVYVLAVRDDVPAAHSGSDNDYESLHTNRDGMLWVTPGPQESDLATQSTTHVKKYYTNAGAVTDGIIWSPAAGKRWYVTDIFINVSAAATVTLEDDLAGGDSAVWKAELAANSGWSHSYETPLYSGEDAADLIITTSAGNVYVTVTGYEI